ncbi:MAG: hypothetical protein JNN01_14580 [Opitutaceae bacterium]|nr:hypothetical protein [Opitutaceae bacterium]
MLASPFAGADPSKVDSRSEPVGIPRLENLVVDGSGAEWGETAFRVDLVTDDSPAPRSAEDFAAEVRLAWTETGLAVLVHWRDDVADEATLPGGIYERDAVELYLSPSPGSPTYFQVVISPGLSSAQPELRHFVYHFTRDEAWLKAASGLQVARQRQGRSAVIEALLPWGTAGLDFRTEESFAFRIFVDDADGGASRWRRTWTSAERDYHWLERASSATAEPVRAVERPPVDERLRFLRAPQNSVPPFKAERDFARIECDSYVFAHDRFPEWDFLDPIRTRERLGAVKVSVRYFDETGEEQHAAVRPGRYGAVFRVESDVAAPFSVYRTLYRLPWNGSSSGERTDEAHAIELAENAEEPLVATMRSAAWWHRIKKQLGVATRYEKLIEIPRGYAHQPERRWPVLLFLHGSGFGKETLLRAEAPLRFAQSSPDYPFILVQPMSGAAWEPPALADLLDEVGRDYRVDLDRVYLAGFSLGGIGTWATALAMPDRFAAIVPVAARGGEPALAKRLAHLPVWAWNGEQDPTTRVEQVQRMIDALKSIAGDSEKIRLTVVPGLSHPPTPDHVFSRPELYAWLLQHKRRSPKRVDPRP